MKRYFFQFELTANGMKRQLCRHLAVVVILLHSLLFAVGNDSLIISSLRVANGSLEGISMISTANGGQVIGGIYRETGASFEKVFLLKLDPAGSVVWNKILDLPATNLRINKIIELGSGEIVITGRSFTAPHSAFSYPFVSKIGLSGELIWTRTVGTSLIESGAFGITITAIQEGLPGEIILMATALGEINDVPSEHGLFLHFDNDGSIVRNKLFAFSETSNNSFAGIFYKDGRIILFGLTHDGECPGSDIRGIYSMQLDYNTGDVLDTKRYCFADIPSLGVISIWNHAFRVDRIGDKFVMYGFLGESNAINRHQLVAVFDEQLEVQQSRYITTPFLSPLRVQLKVDAGLNLYTVGAKPGGNEYFANLSLDGAIKNQMSRSTNAGPTYYITEGGNNISLTADKIVSFQNVVNSGYTFIEVVKRSYNFRPTESCALKDTAFSIVNDHFGLFSSGFNFASTESDLIPIIPMQLNEAIAVFSNTPLCEDANYCTAIKIAGPDTVCVSDGYTHFLISRNMKCNQSVVWDLNPSDVNAINKISDSTVTVNFKAETGTRKITVYAHLEGDHTIRDSMEVTLLCSGTSLKPQYLLCPGDTIKLTPGNWFKSYVWQDGSTDSVLHITKAGTYSVQIGDYCNGVQTLITTITQPEKLFQNTATLKLCAGDFIDITPVAGYSNYKWEQQDGLLLLPGNAARIHPSHPDASYYLEATAFPGCIIRDSLKVKLVTPVKPNFGADTAICAGQSLTIKTTGTYRDYEWNDGTTAAQNIITVPGTYWLKVTDPNGCVAADSVTITLKPCSQRVAFPNAFTPDGNGRNDIFKPSVQGTFSFFDVKIYNRYGQIVFTSNRSNAGWDGRFQSKPQPAGLYLWVCRYQFSGQSQQIEKGNIILLR